ncbi:S8 family serine peptidase [Rufibacter tibetensis]|uniref:S8 family serine peptidase n=1 Tax=Rufibacter tibetensis TaxID=512763 RepID=UPI00147058F0|nr:S8 family serine peptidase [Rufibacter tibetensis]
MSRTAGVSAVQEVVQRVAQEKAVQKFPQAVSLSGAKTSKKNAVDLSLIYQLRYNPGQPFEQVKKKLLSTGLVEYVEPLYLHEPLTLPSDPQADSVSGSQNYLKKIEAYRAWNITQGDTNVVIGILDTGVKLTHEDLKNNLKYNYADPIDGIDNDRDGFVDNFRGWDLADNDNDPTADANGHGTMVTGVASAQPNNGVGMTGVGFNCKFLPIKIYASTPKGSFKGYEAIVYAADHGCKVINLSWGAASFSSAYEQDIINYATINKDVVIVAAAGNTNDELDFYPASYQNVLSVAALDKGDVKGQSNTYSYNIDLGAQGVDVFTTNNAGDTRYGSGSGSSLSSPMVAGAAALIRSYFPSLTASQVMELLRATADDIYSLAGNTAYLEKLGKGRLNIFRALSEKNTISVRMTSWNIVGTNALTPGAEFKVAGNFTNYLSPVAGLQVNVTSSSPYVQVVKGSVSLGSFATLGTADNQTNPFTLKIAENVPANTPVTIRFGYTNGTYSDFQYIKLVLNPDFQTTDVNNVVASIMSNGNIGYNGLKYTQGKGVTYKGSDPLLPEGGLLIGYSPTHVSDNIRNEKGTTDQDFYAVTYLQRKPNSPNADFFGSNVMEDSLTATKTKSLRIQQNVYAWSDAPNQDYVVLEYVLTNRSTETITDAFAGMFVDWDIKSASKNMAEWNDKLHLGITRHRTDSSIWAGIQLLSKGAPGFFALDNTAANGINLSDGFSTQEKYLALSGGVQRERAGFEEGKDVYFVISSKIKSLAPSQADTVAFAIVAGGSREEINRHATAALQKYNQITATKTVTSSPTGIASKAISLFPNPSQGRFTVSLPTALQQTSVEVQLLDSRGQITPQGSFQKKSQLDFDFTNLSAGMYYLRFISSAGVMTQKFMISK